jgi:hypothetical protein
MPVRAEVVLDNEEWETLEHWARRPKTVDLALARAASPLHLPLHTDLQLRPGCEPVPKGRYSGEEKKP